MGDKKKKKEKDKKKDKKRDRDEKKKHKKRHETDSDDSDDSDSDSSVSRDRHKKDKKGRKIKKEKERSRSKKKTTSEKETPALASNNPYNFSEISVFPAMKGPVLPPPAPNVPSTASVPKPKVKEPNIFKLLPKLHYGSVLFAKTIFSGEYLNENVLDTLLVEMTKNIEQTIKEEQHKKAMSGIAKCINELDKIMTEEKEEQLKLMNPNESPVKEKSNRYENVRKIYV